MNSKEALETLGNVTVAVSNIRTGRTFVKTLKEEYEKEFEVLEKELLFVRDIKPFDVYEEQYKKLEKVIEILKRFHFKLNETRHNNTGFELWTDSLLEYEEITQEEYELLKEYLWAE